MAEPVEAIGNRIITKGFAAGAGFGPGATAGEDEQRIRVTGCGANAGLNVFDITWNFTPLERQEDPAPFIPKIVHIGADSVSGDDNGVTVTHENKDDTIVFNPGMVKLGTVRFKGRCGRHPGFDPRDGLGGIRGGCRRCQLLLEIHESHAHLVELIRKAKNDVEPVLERRGAVAVIVADERQTTLF
jgi:hypothetical protein